MAGQFEDFAFGFTSNKICKLTDLNVTSNRINNKGGIIHSLAIDTNVKSRQVNVASNDMEYNTITSKSRSFEPTRFVRKEHVAEEGWDRGEREAEFRVTPTGSGSAGQKSILTLGVIGPLEEKRGDTDRAFWLGQANASILYSSLVARVDQESRFDEAVQDQAVELLKMLEPKPNERKLADSIIVVG
ncbi:hypothetical protein BLNAU_7221 [Blattamonas nauphoetae]|uniref:Uncharacterized protein n=1 Tax=Blattamonas nauphoetae TaxID=2049346 RepID=A0ABQ9Y208_9EUKA|nr:hypothetical protein BLNAU_7221 [Blattamonas nauphoetae]